MSSQAAGAHAPGGLQLGRFLPLSLTVTLAVTVLPLAAISELGPAHNPLAIAVHVLAAVALSMLVARVLAGLWTRHESSSDLVFGDLLLWGWVRRALAERRLDATAGRLASAQSADDDDRVVLMQRMSILLEARDPYTHGHSRRVARHAERIAREMGMPREQVEKVRAAALVHDLGKINVPRAILNKPARLTEAEFALVKRHPGDGAAMVAGLGDAQLTAIVRHHHERMDGTGYPDGLADSDIPLGARVIAVADTFDAITSSRAYRRTRTHKQALEVLQREAGTQLDPLAVAAFVSYYVGRRSVGFVTVLAAAPQRLLTALGGVGSGIGASVAPLAQTACGVGGVALIGACLGGAALPPASTQADAGHAAAKSQLASRASAAGAGPSAPGRGDQGGGRTRARRTQPVAGRGGSSATPAPRENTTPRSLDAPNPGSGGGNAGGGGGGGSASGGGRTVPPLPVLPDLNTVLRPVTDNIPLPQVQAPVQVPSIGLP